MEPIVVRDLDYAFGEGEGEARKQVLFGIDLTITRGSLVALMGPTGSGKTTLLTLMGCLRQVQTGSIKGLGKELAGADTRTLEALRQQLGFIFQAHNLHESLTVRQNVLMALKVHGLGDPDRQSLAAEHVLELVGLEDRVDYLPEKLSGGQKQRVAVARALVANPEIVFADEPTAALCHWSACRRAASGSRPRAWHNDGDGDPRPANPGTCRPHSGARRRGTRRSQYSRTGR